MAESNLPAITIGDFVNIVKLQLNEGNYRPLFGLGKGGIGKSESIGELTKELGIGYIDIRLLLYSESDLKGIPYPNAEHIKTIWLQNNILPTKERDGERGILVLDEITSATKSVRTAAYQLLNERKLGEYKLPDKWLIVCLGNGEEDGGDYQGMEGNFANRCSVYNIIPHLETFKEWAIAKKLNPLVLAYVTFKPSDLHSYNPEAENEILFASPRSWKAISDILNANEFNEDDRILTYRILANVGQRVGYQFISFCKYKNSTIDPEKILKEGDMTTSDKHEIINITIQSIVKLLKDRMDMEVQARNEISEETIKWISNGLKWMMQLKTEFAVVGIKDLIRSNPDLLRKIILHPTLQYYCPEIVQFATTNKAVFD